MRTSRLSCNIPLVKKNLRPLNFTDVTENDCTAALLAVFEKNDIRPMPGLVLLGACMFP